MTSDIFANLARVFEYPSDMYLSNISQFAETHLATQQATADQLKTFVTTLSGKSLGELRELYSATFDLTPACAPYLSVHLFGEGNFKRSKLMTGLAETYTNLGIHYERELPDHLSIVLSALNRLPADLFRDLVALCLTPALERMKTELQRQNNPYLHAISAVEECCRSSEPAGEVRYA